VIGKLSSRVPSGTLQGLLLTLVTIVCLFFHCKTPFLRRLITLQIGNNCIPVDVWVENSLSVETLESRVVSVVEVSAIEGVGLRRSDNGLVAVTLGSPTPSTEPIGPVDRISIEAMDDVDQLAVASGEGSRVRESQGGSQA